MVIGVARGEAQRKMEQSREQRDTFRMGRGSPYGFPSPSCSLTASREKAPLMGKTLDRSPHTSDLNPAWKLHDAFETYGVKNWGKGYFGINKHGHVTVHPDKDPERAIDLKEQVSPVRPAA
jgi:hypothetical protein